MKTTLALILVTFCIFHNAALGQGHFDSPVTLFGESLLPCLSHAERAKVQTTKRGFYLRADTHPGFENEYYPSESGIYLDVAVRDPEEIPAFKDLSTTDGVITNRTVEFPAQGADEVALRVSCIYGRNASKESMAAIETNIQKIVKNYNQGEWKIIKNDEQAIVQHEHDAKSQKAPSIKGLADILASRDKSIPLKHVTFSTYFNNDPTVQFELLNEFKSRHSDILNEAFKSSGNIHNPKVLPVQSKFAECLLKTPTLTKVNEAFLAHGYSVKRVEFEKFWIDKEKEAAPFHAAVWLILEPIKNE